MASHSVEPVKRRRATPEGAVFPPKWNGKMPRDYPNHPAWKMLNKLQFRLNIDYEFHDRKNLWVTPESLKSRRALFLKIQEALERELAKPEGDTFLVIDRKSWDNIEFDPRYGIVMKPKPEKLVLVQPLRYNRLRMIMSRITENLVRNVCTTKRDIYYMDSNCFGFDQRMVDEIVDDLACNLRVPRVHLHVLTTSKGLVYGPLQLLTNDGKVLLCDHQPAGFQIPNNMSEIVGMRSSAKFVLIVEKDCTFQNMVRIDEVHWRMNCIMVTGKGYPDACTRHFVQMLWDQLRIPIICLVDADPHGIEIMCTYRYGSVSMAYDCASLATPQVRWLGIFPSEMRDNDVPEFCFLKLSDRDRAKIKELRDRPYAKCNDKLLYELDCLEKADHKIELQALNESCPTYLSHHYLQRKIYEGSFI